MIIHKMGWKQILTEYSFLTFPACFWIPIIFSNLNSNSSNLLYLRNLQEQVKKVFCYQKLFWPFTVPTNSSSDLKNFSRSLEQFFLTVGQNNFGKKNTIFFCKKPRPLAFCICQLRSLLIHKGHTAVFRVSECYFVNINI